jgi:hypothetical protein
MTKWEHLWVVFGAAGSISKVEMVNGTPVKDWKHGRTVIEFVNALGDEGWEVVAKDGAVVILKRPKG